MLRKRRSPPAKSPPPIIVRPAPGRPTHALVTVAGRVEQAAIGRSGRTARKREGDGATPIAAMALLDGYVRRDRLRTVTSRFPLTPIDPQLLWCDAPGHPIYNRPTRRPLSASHERMARADGLYDVCLVMDWNIRQRRRNAGSAIFFHLIRPGYQPTEGCIAVSLPTMRRILKVARRGTVVQVVG